MDLRPTAPTRPALVAALAAICGLAAALPYLRGGPVWDDHELILGHLARLPAAELPGLAWRPVGGGAVGGGYFRPVSMVLLSLLGRIGVPAVHAAAALLHALAAALLARRIGVLAVVFAMHPVIGEVLGWASALPDALALSLGLAAVTVGEGEGRRAAAGAALLAALAVLSKEVALVVVLAFWLDSARRPRGALLGLAAGLGLRLAVGAAGQWDLEGKLGLVPLALSSAWSLFAWPWPADPLRDLHALGLPRVLVGALSLALAAVIARRRADRRAAAGLLLLVGAPALALPPTLHGYLAAERYVYPALAGLCLLLAPVGGGGPDTRAGAATLPRWALGAPALALLLHLPRAPMWSSDLRLFGAAVSAAPQSAFAWHFLGEAQLRAQDAPAAAAAFAQAWALQGRGRADRGRLVASLVLSGRADEALRIAEEGVGEDLSAEELAWWARAAAEAGATARATALLRPLRGPQGWDGPAFVPALAAQLGLD